MFKRYSIVLLLFVIISCKSKEEKTFFDFDNVEYYSLNKSKEEEISRNSNIGVRDSIFESVFYKDYPDTLNSSVFLKMVNSDGFSRFELSEKDVEYLRNDVFIEKISLKMFELNKACAPEYRDILVFKKNSKISGIAKICLWCGHFYFISSKKNIQTEEFGTEKDYEALKKIFNTYKKK
ncbi:hypothetical protein CFS9_15260 [Flavobacterium sp. CFS9]|uniref:Lipoprotein n=1 Tax=Flavobacterium sp. CFS9 TaxID=3143118 RepID=A0AAT9H075_9FLAO